ncbi:uncharacterized protein V6R79_020059 [Siganus canaliculatus]
MLAEARGPDPLGSRRPWRSSTAGKKIKMKHGKKHQRQASSQRSSVLGLEMKPELVWEDWDLRQEFTKTLVLKNVHSKLQKLHLRPPVSKFFTTMIHPTICLSPGTSLSVPVTFKPLQRCEYEDNIEFQSKEGNIQVSLRAVIPCHALEVPESVLLPFCAVQHSAQSTFLLRNVSKLQTFFHLQCSDPFQFSPDQGLLKPGQECQITVVFTPQEALVYQQQACCRFGEEGDMAESCCTILLQGLAKYPCLQLRYPGTIDGKQQCGPELHFGSVAIGQSLQKHIEIVNVSPVTTSFSLSLLSNGLTLLGSEFSCDVTEGLVPPGGSLPVTVTYTPAVVDAVSVEYLTLKCRGALSKTLLKLTGDCEGPKLSLSSSVVDFNRVEKGEAVMQTVKLVNTSSAEAIFQWDLDCSGHSVFNIQPACGTVRPCSHTTLKVVYRPTQPIAHHRRVACLILHKDPIFLDLIGTCHSQLQHPPILKPEHLVLYNLHWNRRQDPPSTHSAEQQDPNQQEPLCSQEAAHQRTDSADAVLRTSMEEYYQSHLGIMDPRSSSSSSSPPLLSVEPNELLFSPKLSSSSCRSVSITSHTKGKLRLVWTAALDSPFSVSPESCDLAPLKSTSFRVTYDPKKLNTLHGAELECFALYKDNEKELICLPWYVTVKVIGHSFQPGKQHFVPCCSLKPPQVVFPGYSVLSYRTALLQNCGDLPITFCLGLSSEHSRGKSVSVLPSCGFIHPGCHQILTIRTTPSEDSPKQGFTVPLQLNADQHTKELRVFSVVEKPCLSLEGEGSLYFHPAAVGSKTQRPHSIRNLCRLPLRFQWSIPESDQGLICVEPDAGELHPNESLVQMWSFSPLAEKSYSLTSTLTYWPIHAPGSDRSQLTLRLLGVACKGFIKAEKAVLDVGDILVGSCRSIEIPLLNNSLCPVSCSFSVQQRLLHDDPAFDPNTLPNALLLDCEKGTITSQSTMLLRSTVRPHIRAQYLWTISYQTLTDSGSVSSTPQTLCEVQARGVFPTLKVIDVCGGGCADKLGKLHLWEMFSLDRLNEDLLCSPSPAELTYKTPTRHSLRSCFSVFTKTMVDFNFGAATLHSDATSFMLMFHNPGSILVDWAFLFPEDQQIELEYWAETGEFSTSDLYHMKVQDNQLFSVSPRSGTLLPGQQMAVYFSYSHSCVGTDRFPVVFKLSYGREILLNFQGTTVDREKPFVHCVPKRRVFTSVTIGECTPPKQTYEIHNSGTVPVHYEVDTEALSQLHRDNFNQPVLSCLNPVGVIQPGQATTLEWIFFPLEAKTYHMNVPVHVKGGDSTLMRFEGSGLSSSALNSQMSFKGSAATASEPCVQRSPFPGQVVFLSEDCASFGDIPVSSQFSRNFFLTNVSHTDTVLFLWDTSHHQVLEIHPERGRLCPGDCVLCVLTFTSADYPTCYQLDVICQVTQEAALTRYHDALEHWEEEQKRQDEFIITDKPVPQADLIHEELDAAPVRKGPPLRKYKTLPPICTSGSYEPVGAIVFKTTKAERRAQRDKAKVWRRPEPPRLLLLHLEVKAHSHRLLEHHKHFPDQSNKGHRCLQSVHNKPEVTFSSPSLPTGSPPQSRSSERVAIRHMLTFLLRDILSDPAFIQSLIVSESNPITEQFQETSPHHCSSSSTFIPFPRSSTPLQPMSQLQACSSEITCSPKEQPNPVDKEGTADCPTDSVNAAS